MNARRHRRNSHRRHRRNPGILSGGLVKTLGHGFKQAAIILVAKTATQKVGNAIPFGGGSVPLQLLKQLGVAALLYTVARKVLPRFANEVLIGAMLAPTTTAISMIPGVGAQLAGAPPGLGLWNPIRVDTLRGAPPGLGRFERGGGGYGDGALGPLSV